MRNVYTLLNLGDFVGGAIASNDTSKGPAYVQFLPLTDAKQGERFFLFQFLPLLTPKCLPAHAEFIAARGIKNESHSQADLDKSDSVIEKWQGPNVVVIILASTTGVFALAVVGLLTYLCWARKPKKVKMMPAHPVFVADDSEPFIPSQIKEGGGRQSYYDPYYIT